MHDLNQAAPNQDFFITLLKHIVINEMWLIPQHEKKLLKSFIIVLLQIWATERKNKHLLDVFNHTSTVYQSSTSLGRFGLDYPL